MDRREFVASLAGGATTMLTSAVDASNSTASGSDWENLRSVLGNKLLSIRSPLATCAEAGGVGADDLFGQLKNPFFLGDDPSLTQTLGWTNGWVSQASPVAVAAESGTDIAIAVNFARQRGVRPVVKGGGHSYFGNSNAANSLLIWTRRMDRVELHEAFRPAGAPNSIEPVAAIDIGAGALWGRVYSRAAANGRYVQGGGCLTVGVAGFVQGGGFGSFSKQFGTGAANMLEAEIVTADGQIRVANAYRDPELFFGLRGGGGGTFGVVTRLTLKTYPLPDSVGAVLFRITASTDAAWRALVDRVIDFYATSLFNPSWGEQIRFLPGRRLDVSMLCHGLGKEAIEAVWKPFFGWTLERRTDYAFREQPTILSIPGDRFFNPKSLREIPGVVAVDDRPGASDENVFWETNRGEAGQFIHAYRSMWLPEELLSIERRPQLTDAIVAGSAEWSLSLHVNKGLAGGSPQAIDLSRQTATNPAMLGAFALLICAADGSPAWPGIKGYEPDPEAGRVKSKAVGRAVAPFEAIVPHAGSYMSEADYFGVDWRQAYWGPHYARLASIKRQYDPTNLFRGHHTVEPS